MTGPKNSAKAVAHYQPPLDMARLFEPAFGPTDDGLQALRALSDAALKWSFLDLPGQPIHVVVVPWRSDGVDRPR